MHFCRDIIHDTTKQAATDGPGLWVRQLGAGPGCSDRAGVVELEREPANNALLKANILGWKQECVQVPSLPQGRATPTCTIARAMVTSLIRIDKDRLKRTVHTERFESRMTVGRSIRFEESCESDDWVHG